MPTVIDSAPSAITIPRDDCVEVVIVAHNDDAVPAVLGSMTVRVGDRDVVVNATLPGADSTPVEFGAITLSADLVAAGVTWEDHGGGHYLVCGPDFDPSTHEH